MQIIKIDQLPDLIHCQVILEVQLVPLEGCKCFQNNEIWICVEKLTYKHLSYADKKTP